MKSLEDIAAWLESTLDVGDGIYINHIDANKQRCVGVYSRAKAGKQYIAIGGQEATLTAEKSISVLVHWTNNADTAETKAHQVYQALQDMMGDPGMGVYHSTFNAAEPISVGRDEYGIFEYVIEVKLLYERKE